MRRAKKLLISMCVVSAVGVSFLLGLETFKQSPTMNRAESEEYTLVFDSSNRLTENGGVVNTANGSPISFEYANLNAYEGGWQTLDNRNTLSYFANMTAISGLVSLTYTGNEPILVYYGYSEQSYLICSPSITSGTTYDFDGALPSFFRVESRSSETSIESLTLKYRCVPGEAVASDLTYELREDGESYRVIGVNGEPTSIVIPETFRGKPVTEVYPLICESLVSLHLSKNITSVSGLNFYRDLPNMASITVDPENETYTTIGGLLFTKDGKTLVLCPAALEEETLGIPYSTTFVSKGSFSQCSKIKQLMVSNENTVIAQGAFQGFTSLETYMAPFIGGSKTSNNFVGYVFGAKNPDAASYYIPKSLATLILVGDVTQTTFEGCSNVKNITMMSTSSIAQNAFVHCTSIEKLSIPWLVPEDAENPTIGYYFGSGHYYDNGTTIPKSLEEVGISNALGKLPDRAFYRCRGLKEVTFGQPSALTEIGSECFTDCENLVTLNLSKTKLTSVGQRAFDACKSLSSIQFPKTLKTIGDYAFRECSSLEEVKIFDGVETIGKYIFSYCPSLKRLRLPFVGNSLETPLRLYELFGNYYSSVEAKLQNIESIEIGDVCTELAKEVFASLPELVEVSLGASMEYVGPLAFSGCHKLHTVAFANPDTQFGYGAFSGCTSLDITDFNFPVAPDSLFYNCTGLTEITFGNRVTEIGESIFYGASNLNSITFGSSVKRIGKNIFGDKKDVAIYYDGTPADWCDIEIAGSLPKVPIYFQDPNGDVVHNGKSYSLPTELVISEGPTKVGAWQFSNMSNLVNVTLPTTLTEIGDNAFDSCSNLVSILVPGAVNRIGKCAFAKCTSLHDMTLPFVGESITSENNNFGYIFSGVTEENTGIPESLENLAFLGTCTSIPASSFLGVQNLKKVELPTTIETIGDEAFRECSLSKINFPASLTSIGQRAFYKSGLTSIGISSPSISIGKEAFRSCESLVNIWLLGGVTTLPNMVFYECTSVHYMECTIGLTSSDIPESVQYLHVHWVDGVTLEEHGRYRLPNLEAITFEYGLPRIPASWFASSSPSLWSCTIPNSVTEISQGAFLGCTSLHEIEFDGTKAEWDAITKASGWKGDAPITWVRTLQDGPRYDI